VTSSDIPEWAKTLAVFDTETTGIDPETTRIVSAHVSLLTESGESTDAQNWLIDCGIDIPESASQIHGITTERMRSEGTPAAESVQQIIEKLSGYLRQGTVVVAFNASYDFTILDREARRYGLTGLVNPRPLVDPMVLDRQVDRYRKGKRTLDAATQLYGVELVNAHDASADAIAAGRVAQAIARKYATELAMPALDLHDLQVSWAHEQATRLAEWHRSQGRPTSARVERWPIK
jgi:DNA polymerase-3 subunit epsilon